MNQTAKEEFEFKTEMAQLLHLLANSLYTNKEIFLRELISNASDALNKLHFISLTDSAALGEDGELKVKLVADEKTKEFTLIDNGVGMTKEDLINNLGTVAKSGTQGFIDELKKGDGAKSDLIGRFGVGFYSVFMVTEEVTVETRHYQSEQAFRWVSKGTGSFSIEEIDDAPRGTKIHFKLKKDDEQFASPWTVENTVKKYSDFLSFPIEINGEKKNRSEALWRRRKSEVKKEEYDEFFKYISHKTSEPLHVFHFNVEGTSSSYDSVLFIPSESDRNLFQYQGVPETNIHLYVRRVFIQDDCKALLPGWLRFMQGIVDSQDLPLNVSREVTQSSGMMEKINKHLTKKVLEELSRWAKNDKAKFTGFWKNFGNILKEGIHMDFLHRDKLIELFHCHSSKSPDDLISLADYVERMDEGQKEIYYVFAKSRESIENSPNYEYFLNKNIEVLFLYEEIDDFLMPMIGPYKEKNLVSIDKAEISKNDDEKDDPETDASNSENVKLLQYFKDVLGDEVADVVASQRLVDSPCTLVLPKEAANPHMERMMKMMDENYTAAKRILEVNLKNPIIVNLKRIRSKFPQDKLVKDCIFQLYESSALVEGILEDPTKMRARANEILKVASDYHLKSAGGGD